MENPTVIKGATPTATTATNNNTANNVGISSPWITMEKKITALFNEDPDLDVLYDDATKTVTIESVNTYKIMALEKVLKKEIAFGNVTLKIQCRVKNAENASTVAADVKTAFRGNPRLSDIIVTPTPFTSESVYVLFKKEVIQFFNDDISDYYGNYNGLSEEIAREITSDAIVVNYGTDVKDPN